MRVMGIDPGTRKCGICIIDTKSQKIIHLSEIDQSKSKENIVQRSINITLEIEDLIKKYKVDIIIYEKPFGKGTSAIVGLNQLIGMIIITAIKLGCETIEIQPSEIYRIMGTAKTLRREDKKRLAIKHVVLKYRYDEENITDNKADAVLIAELYKKYVVGRKK